MTHTIMNPNHLAFKHVVAFEVSKDTLVVHTLPANEQRVIANTRGAARRLLAQEARRNVRDAQPWKYAKTA